MTEQATGQPTRADSDENRRQVLYWRLLARIFDHEEQATLESASLAVVEDIGLPPALLDPQASVDSIVQRHPALAADVDHRIAPGPDDRAADAAPPPRCGARRWRRSCCSTSSPPPPARSLPGSCRAGSPKPAGWSARSAASPADCAAAGPEAAPRARARPGPAAPAPRPIS